MGNEKEFVEAFSKAAQIGQGKLGWQGQAEIMYDFGLMGHIGIKLKGSKKQKIATIKNYLIEAAMSEIYKYGEWLPEAEAKLREKANKVLYGSKD